MPISSPRLASPIKLGRRALSCLKRAPNRTRWAGPGRGASPNRSRRGSCGGRRRTCARDSYKTPSPAPGDPSHGDHIANRGIVETPDKGSTVHGLGGGGGVLLEDQAIHFPAACLEQRGGGGHLRAGRPSGAQRGGAPPAAWNPEGGGRTRRSPDSIAVRRRLSAGSISAEPVEVPSRSLVGRSRA